MHRVQKEHGCVRALYQRTRSPSLVVQLADSKLEASRIHEIAPPVIGPASPVRLHLLSLLVALVVLIGCENNSTPEQRHQEAVAKVGVDATITAALFVSAVRACDVVGLSDVNQCAKLGGSLAAEQSAQIIAKLSIEQTAKYWKSCQAAFSTEYCSQLIQRAVAIEYRKPRASHP